MQDPRNTSAKPSRRKRRAILIAMIFASPVMADQPRSGLGMPPLPLQVHASTIQSNPFVKADSAAPTTSIQLASGASSSAIKLKPIGAAIGLQPIQAGQARRVQPSALTIEPVGQSAIQENCLIGSAHHENHSLVQTGIADVCAAKNPSTATENRSSIVLMPVAPIQSPQPVSKPSGQSGLEFVAPKIAASGTTSASDLQPAEAVVQAPVVQATEETEPICFSFSDNDESEITTSSERETTEEPKLATETVTEDAIANDSDPQLVSPIQLDSEPTEELELVPADVAEEQAVASDQPHMDFGVVEPFVIDETNLESGEPLELAALDNVIEGDEMPLIPMNDDSVVSGPVQTPEPSLHAKRYRPPVAVTPVPISIERTADENTFQVHSVVEATPKSALDQAIAKSLSGESKLTRLHLSRAQVRSLTVRGTVHGVKVADKSVCQAFSAGPSQLKLIGTGNGVTKLVVWAKSTDESEKPRMRAFEVHVEDAVEASGSSVGVRAEVLNQSIRGTFPNARVNVEKRGDQLIVTGSCGSEAIAKKIIRLVRKTCLVPVQDELQVR